MVMTMTKSITKNKMNTEKQKLKTRKAGYRKIRNAKAKDPIIIRRGFDYDRH